MLLDCKLLLFFTDVNSNPSTGHSSGTSASPLLLILGYANGIQIWMIPVSVEWFITCEKRWLIFMLIILKPMRIALSFILRSADSLLYFGGYFRCKLVEMPVRLHNV